MRKLLKTVCCMLLVSGLLSVVLLAGAETAAEPVFTVSVVLKEGMTATDFAVYDTGETAAAEDGGTVCRIEYNDAAGVGQALTFDYLGGSELIPLLRFADLNGDGWLDIEALYVAGATNAYSTYFICSGEDMRFTKCEALGTLSSFQVYPRQQLILNYEHNSAATGVYTMFRWVDGQPVVFRRAVVDYDSRDNYESIRETVTEYDADGAETVLMDETHPMYPDAEEWQPWDARRTELLWQGLDSTEEPQEPGD